jgi:predicted DsbA family dithiol-disulfide isomerase
MTLTVDVISDVICPWCFVGKRRLEQAIRALRGGHEVRVRWHPFQLNPHMPKEGMSRRDYRTAKFGSWEQSRALDAQMKEVGAAEGIPFALDQIERTPNTLDAHRLIWLAGEQGVQDDVVEALFRAYFCAARNIGARETLLDVGAEAGLARDRTQGVLDSGAGLDAIRAAEEHGHQLGVQGVPFFVIDGELTLSGAQKPELFLTAFERQITTGTRGDGNVCGAQPGQKPPC